jgi:hypothetical protein
VESQLMGYKATLEKNINKAFKMIGDLAISVTLKRKTKSTFNFDTLDVKNTESVDLITLAVITEIKKPTLEHNTRVSSMMLKTKEVGDINLFDSVIINNDIFKIGPVISTDNFITSVEVYKEG